MSQGPYLGELFDPASGALGARVGAVDPGRFEEKTVVPSRADLDDVVWVH